jgi:tetratricopeptide (TPR) repeat protein
MRLSILICTILLVAGPLVWAQDLEDLFTNLQEAETKKDTAQIKKLASETLTLAHQVVAATAPESGEDKENFTVRVARAREIQVRAEYSLYATAASAPAATAVDLLSTLERLSPKSKYLDEGYSRYFQALSQTGASAKIPGVAENALKNFPENADALLMLADTALRAKQSDRAAAYAERAIASLNKRGKPGMALGQACWIAGIVHMEKSQFFEANKDLRAALPFIRGNDAMLGPALFHLGVANYQLGRTFMRKAQVVEAVKFSEEASRIKGPFAEQAYRNAYIMKTEGAKMR